MRFDSPLGFRQGEKRVNEIGDVVWKHDYVLSETPN